MALGDRDRLHALDAVRAIALLLGVAIHALASFAPGAFEMHVAPVVDVSSTPLASAISFVIHSFRMSLFFLIAGFFASLMCQRRGIRGFLRNRVQRILVPFLVGWIVLLPLMTMTWSWGTGPARFLPIETWPPAIRQVPLSHLWFLYYLLWIYAGAAVVRSVAAMSPVGNALMAIADRFTLIAFRSAWLGPVAVMAPMFAALLVTRNTWLIASGMAPPNTSLIPHVTPLFVYGLAFGIGWMINRNREVLQLWGARWKRHIATAVLATLACGVFLPPSAAANIGLGDYAPLLPRALFAASYTLAGACWTMGITGIAIRFLSSPGRVWRYLADASYWVYLVHYPIVVLLQDVLARVPLHWSVKVPVILLATVALTLVSYQFAVRYTFIGRTLNGARTRPGAIAAAQPA